MKLFNLLRTCLISFLTHISSYFCLFFSKVFQNISIYLSKFYQKSAKTMPKSVIKKDIKQVLIFLIITSCSSNFMVSTKTPELKIYQKKDDLKIFKNIEYNWWNNFGDPALDELIKIVISDDYDYKTVVNRIILARNNLNFSGSQNQVANSNSKIRIASNSFYNNFDASWELDLFGVNGRSENAAKTLFETSNDSKNYILVSLISEIVSNYSQIKAAQNNIIIEEKILKYYSEILKVNSTKNSLKSSENIGSKPVKAEIINSKINLAEAKSKIKILSKNIELLLGQNNDLEKLLNENKNIPILNDEIIFEASLIILRNRPDIKNAEKDLSSISGLKNIAIGKIFPEISLTSFLGFRNKKFNNSKSFNEKLEIKDLAIAELNFAAIIAENKLSKQIEKKALLDYKSKVLFALNDVEFSLSNFIKEKEKFNFNEEKLLLAQKILNLNKEKYLTGSISYEEYLSNEIDFLKLEKEKINSKLLFFNKSIAVYKSLGGGWEVIKQNSIEENNYLKKKKFKLANS
jgi:outer membrane protein TolC